MSGGRRRFAGPQGAFTLLEVLLASALTALVALGGWAWLRGVTQAGHRAQLHLEVASEALAVVRLLQDDLQSAALGSIQQRGAQALVMRTQAQLPGSTLRGWREVMWRSDPAAGLLRSEEGVERVVSPRLRCTWRTDEQTPPRWWATLTPSVATEGVPTDPRGVPWDFLLGSP